MADQNLKNHTRMVPPFHYVAFSLVSFALAVGIIHFFKAIGAGSGRLNAAAVLCLVVGAVLALWFARSFALKAQDRAIRAEENFRHYILTGKPFDTNIQMRQIIALRFASDAEYVALAKRAVDEKMSAKNIKAAIQNWKPDYNRV